MQQSVGVWPCYSVVGIEKDVPLFSARRNTPYEMLRRRANDRAFEALSYTVMLNYSVSNTVLCMLTFPAVCRLCTLHFHSFLLIRSQASTLSEYGRGWIVTAPHAAIKSVPRSLCAALIVSTYVTAVRREAHHMIRPLCELLLQVQA
jgi:hypothetical protein